MTKYDSKSLVPVIILSLMFSLVPITGTVFNLRSGSVHGWFEELFGGPKNGGEPVPDTTHAIFIQFDGISGESIDASHVNWINVDSFEFLLMSSGSGVGTSRSRGEIIANDILFTKKVDKSTPKLMESLATGSVISEATIELTDIGTKKTYYKYELTNVIVTSIQSSGDTGGTPIDVVTINFEEIKVAYTEIDFDGSPKGTIEWTWRNELA
jgi:type VI secretion system Hcp family effector